MIIYDKECSTFKYYNENNEHVLLNNITNDKVAEIISELKLCPEFRCDQTISAALFIAMRKSQGLTDDDIKHALL